MTTAIIPADIVKQRKDEKVNGEPSKCVGMIDAPWKASDISKFAVEVNIVVNHHNHTFMCERKKLKTCRLSYKQLIVNETQVR